MATPDTVVVPYTKFGKTEIYGRISLDGTFRRTDTGAFEVFNAANVALYAHICPQIDGTPDYLFTVPSTLPENDYGVVFYDPKASIGTNDKRIAVYPGVMSWDGSKIVTHLQLSNQIQNIGAGAGADTVTLQICLEDGVTPIADADVWISTDALGNNVVAGTLQTNGAGKVTFLLDAGVTYWRWVQKDGVVFSNPIKFVAVAD